MSTSPEYAEYILDQLSQSSGEITHRKMFGGIGVYVDGMFCAIIGSSDRFYLRVGPNNLQDFERENMEKFPGGKGAGMPYYEVPEQVIENPTILAKWAAKAKEAAIDAKTRKK